MKTRKPLIFNIIPVHLIFEMPQEKISKKLQIYLPWTKGGYLCSHASGNTSTHLWWDASLRPGRNAIADASAKKMDAPRFALNYWAWSVCIVELRKHPPNSVPELLHTVERHAASLNRKQIITAVNDILPRAEACIASDGGGGGLWGAFEFKLKSFNKILDD